MGSQQENIEIAYLECQESKWFVFFPHFIFWSYKAKFRCLPVHFCIFSTVCKNISLIIVITKGPKNIEILRVVNIAHLFSKVNSKRFVHSLMISNETLTSIHNLRCLMAKANGYRENSVDRLHNSEWCIPLSAYFHATFATSEMAPSVATSN